MSAPPVGRLVVDCSHPGPRWYLGAVPVRIRIDGRLTEVGWGQSGFDLPAGDHQLRVSVRWKGDLAPAELSVRLLPGQVTTVYYRAPAVQLAGGAIGFTPRRTPGRGAFVAIMVALALVVAFLAVLLTR